MTTSDAAAVAAVREYLATWERYTQRLAAAGNLTPYGQGLASGLAGVRHIVDSLAPKPEEPADV